MSAVRQFEPRDQALLDLYRHATGGAATRVKLEGRLFQIEKTLRQIERRLSALEGAAEPAAVNKSVLAERISALEAAIKNAARPLRIVRNKAGKITGSETIPDGETV